MFVTKTKTNETGKYESSIMAIKETVLHQRYRTRFFFTINMLISLEHPFHAMRLHCQFT